MKVFILLSVVAVVFAKEQCGENQHWTDCGTDCPLTCDNHNNPPKFCNLMCRIGCECDEGYVKIPDGRCINPIQCPQNNAGKCGDNQHWTDCGTTCPLTCENYSNPPKICNLMCKIGCECDEGYVQIPNGRCINPIQCPENSTKPVCGENERYYECGTACPLTCDNYANPPRICPAMCVIGCQCESRYVKTRDGRCVRPESCPSDARTFENNCVDKPESGMCLAYIPMYYYDAEAGDCKKFIYGGCQGNGNRYPTKEECLSKCQVKQSSVGACDLPAETGVCRGYFPRYYYDVQEGKCKQFIYGGCGGNENNFETVEECHNTCAQSAPEACLQEKIVGPCKARFPRFFFNKETGKCEEFIYGGCDGNSNNFNSVEGCQAVCENQQAPQACLEPKVVGPCKAAFKRFFFNQETGECEEFTYGGCRGNSNNFNTKDECHSVCSE